MGLTESEQADRMAGLGGSDANVILSGDRDRIINLWREKRGERPPTDLSDRLPVMLGSWTEDFNRQWFEMTTGSRVTRAGASIACRTFSWRRCTLDGYLEAANCVWEAKHTSAFAKADEVVDRYMPQLQHNMAVTGAGSAVLSVLFGNHKFEVFSVGADWLYQSDLLEAELEFWRCVISGDEPVPAPIPLAPRAIGVREVNLTGNNSWASAAIEWLETRQPAKAHSAACSAIKALIEEDVALAFGHGIEAKRSKNGAITIRERAA
jgi:predicted phage-related endonuclease